jgi:hypothetical protein
MTELRRAVRALGGSVHAVHPSARSITGAGTSNVRVGDAKTVNMGLAGTGVGVAVLDSGVMKSHMAFLNGAGANRVLRNVNMLNSTAANWTSGGDPNVTTLQPGSVQQLAYENTVANDYAATQDAYGHGTHVASVLAGRAKYYAYAGDTSGVAPNANIVDVKVLNDAGQGTLSDAVEGMEWILHHAREYNIRVINISLVTDSSDSWELDPLCIAARSATAAGITVVVAAGNFGKNLAGKEVYGGIGAPGNDPSVITVGAANFKGTTSRADDSVDLFSSRGPTRGARTMADGSKRIDNLLKPDLVAPGNKIVAAGAVVLMLEANPGLTPPLIKAILQYTAQPLPGQNLLQQGTGLLNVSGAVALAKVLRNDLSAAIANGQLVAGSPMLGFLQLMPLATSVINLEAVNWSRLAAVGGNQIVSGQLLTQGLVLSEAGTTNPADPRAKLVLGSLEPDLPPSCCPVHRIPARHRGSSPGLERSIVGG